MSRPAKPARKTVNRHGCEPLRASGPGATASEALKQRGSLTVCSDPSMQWDAALSGRRGRQQAYSDPAIQACLTLKILLGLPLRPGVPLAAICPSELPIAAPPVRARWATALGFMASRLELSGLCWDVPDFSILSRRQSKTGPWRQWRRESAQHGTGASMAARSGAFAVPLGPRRTRRSPPSRPGCQRMRRRFEHRWRRLRHPRLPRRRRRTWCGSGSSGKRSPGPFVEPPRFRPAATRGHGSRTRPELGRATRSCARQGTSAGHSGGTGAGTTAGAEWERR